MSLNDIQNIPNRRDIQLVDRKFSFDPNTQPPIYSLTVMPVKRIHSILRASVKPDNGATSG